MGARARAYLVGTAGTVSHNEGETVSQRRDRWALSTRAISVGRPDEPGQPLNTPIIPATNFLLGGTREYARDTNATWESFEAVVGDLEGGRATAFGSGMAAIEAALTIGLAQVAPGRTPVVAAPQVHYAGSRALLGQWESQGRIAVSWYDGEQTELALAAAGASDVLLLESPANPVMTITDLAAMSAAASGTVICDNTFATALITRPLELGVDVVVQSASKYLAGHSDALLGVAVTTDEGWHGQLRTHRALHGSVPGVLEAWLGTRGVRTLPLRLGAACANAMIIAERLAEHPEVAWVRYPGLPADPGHAVAARQMDAFGAMLAFGVRGGAEAADRVCSRTLLWRPATSLGGVESTLERRARLEFEQSPAELVRASVGCEDVEDLWVDLEQALSAG